VEEVKKDISKRKANASGKVPTPIELINVDFFSAHDKKQVIENLISNENVLLFLYEKLFPMRQDPIVKDLQVQDSYVFLGNKMRMRGSLSSHPSTTDNNIASANFTTVTRSPTHYPQPSI
jgi:hypothetical protein